jgi:2-dehydropantoate 2-reductase
VRYIIYGAGGVGGVIGAQLYKAGIDVVMIARGAHYEAIKDDGLRYLTPFEDVRLTIPVVAHPRDLTPTNADVVVLTMKSQHTRDALDDLRVCRGTNVPIVCCQNGVSNEQEALQRFAEVYAMLVYLPGQLTDPGEVACHAKLKSGVLDLGVFPGGVNDRCSRIAETFEAANFSIRPNPTVMRFKYAKLLMNLNNALEAVASDGEDTKWIRESMKSEGRACFAAAGIDYASADEVTERRAGVFASGEIEGIDRVGGSSKQSLLRGTGDIEADHLNGEIVRLGRLHGVPTPANEVLQRLAVEAAVTRASPGARSCDEVAQMIKTRHASE